MMYMMLCGAWDVTRVGVGGSERSFSGPLHCLLIYGANED